MLVSLIGLCVGMAVLDMHLALKVYEKYVTLPKLRQDRAVFLDAAYAGVALDTRKWRKAINARIARLNRKRLTKIGRTIILQGDMHFGQVA